MCQFSEAWIGKCQQDGEQYCDVHKNLVCDSCGAKATGSCDATGQFCCGAPLCNDCEHTIFPDGTNGGVGFNQEPLIEGLHRHCKKTEQKFTPWYARETC